jgi:FAD synthase
MKATLYGQIERPALAIVGVWDPFLPAHNELFSALIAQATAHSQPSLAILLDPAPQLMMYGPSQWPVYNDLGSRAKLMLEMGLDGLLHLDFTRQDLKAGAGDFFEVVLANVPLAELWLGQRQQLGSGEAGGPVAVSGLADRHRIKVERLQEADLGIVSRDIRNYLNTGRLQEAHKVVGRPPIFARPEGMRLESGWKPGLYRAKALTHWDSSPLQTPETGLIDLTLEQDQENRRYFQWPDRDIEYLAFVAGPGDRVETS